MVVEQATAKINHTALKERRGEIEQLLRALGLSRGPRRLFPRAVGSVDYKEGQIRRLREALESLGPVFSSFGLYLATRVDLLSMRDCLEFADIEDRAEPASPDIVRALIRREIGRPPNDVFVSFEESPFESRLLFQKHHARLRDGRKVTIKLRRPETEGQLILDVELLPLLKFAFGSISTDSVFDSALDDFRFMLLRKIDLRDEADALNSLTRDAETFGILGPASVEPSLCTSRILTVECLPGIDFGEALSSQPFQTNDLARRLCVLWLRQALHGSVFPAEISPGDLVILPGRQIGLTGGVFANLSPESKSNLWSYLIAAAGESPNQACSFLVKELKRTQALDGDGELQHRFRQVVPFRDTEWAGDFLIDHLVVQWRLANEHGYLARQSLPSFFRGLYTVAHLARQLAPQRDVFVQALEDVRLIARMEWFKEMLGPDQFGKQMNQYAMLMMELPQRLDEALTLVAEGQARSQFPRRETRRQNSGALVIALLLVLAAFLLLVQHSGALNGAWTDNIKVLIFVALGACVLRFASRV